MKAVQIAAITLGVVVVLYFLVIALIPEGIIVGFRFRWPWRK
jgi:hypothetical protein